MIALLCKTSFSSSFCEDFIVHSIFNAVVIMFVMNIGDDLHWLSLRCCCLYFKRNLPLLQCFFLSKVIVLANY